MTGFPLLIVLILILIVMILSIAKYKVHPFLAIITASIVFALIGGIPLVDTKTAAGLAKVIGQGFSGTFTSIGIVIILGALIGSILETTGAAFKLADIVISLVGAKKPELAIELMGWVISIPVFCDSGFVILNPIRKALVRKTHASSVAMTVCLSAGLYCSHVFIPPTPGPIAAANTLGIGNNLIYVIFFGIIVSVPALVSAYFYARYVGKKITPAEETNADEIIESYEELKSKYASLPNSWNSIAPLIVPIILMGLASVCSMLGWSGSIADLLKFSGTPVIALGFGTVFAILQLQSCHKLDKLNELTNDTLKTVGPILFVTAAGSVLGKVISSTDIVNFIKQSAGLLQTIGIFFPFILSAILKTAQGSSTVAITTTAGILAPLMGVLGLDSQIMSILTVMAIGAGAMTVSHANDSYFWVVTNFGGLNTQEGYKTQTVVTFIEGMSSIVFIFLLSLMF